MLRGFHSDAESTLNYSKKGNVKTVPGFEKKMCLLYVFIGLSFCRSFKYRLFLGYSRCISFQDLGKALKIILNVSEILGLTLLCWRVLSSDSVQYIYENSEKDRPLKGPRNILTEVEFYAVFCSVAQGVPLSPLPTMGGNTKQQINVLKGSHYRNINNFSNYEYGFFFKVERKLFYFLC